MFLSVSLKEIYLFLSDEEEVKKRRFVDIIFHVQLFLIIILQLCPIKNKRSVDNDFSSLQQLFFVFVSCDYTTTKICIYFLKEIVELKTEEKNPPRFVFIRKNKNSFY